MHADKAGNDGAAAQVENFRAFGDFCAGRVAKHADLSIANHQRLIGARSGAGAVNHARVRQRNYRRVFLDESAHF